MEFEFDFEFEGDLLYSWEEGTGFYVRTAHAASGNFQYFLKGILIKSPSLSLSNSRKSEFVSESETETESKPEEKVYQLFVNMEIFHDWTIDVLEKYF
jgi:hypothetical protein